MMLWVGISFEQSASTSYFRKAREFLLRAGRWEHCTQAIVNLSEDAHFNLLSACNNIGRIPPPARVVSYLLLHLNWPTNRPEHCTPSCAMSEMVSSTPMKYSARYIG